MEVGKQVRDLLQVEMMGLVKEEDTADGWRAVSGYVVEIGVIELSDGLLWGWGKDESDTVLIGSTI